MENGVFEVEERVKKGEPWAGRLLDEDFRAILIIDLRVKEREHRLGLATMDMRHSESDRRS